MSLVTICYVTRSVHVGITSDILIRSLLFFPKRKVYTLEIMALCACIFVCVRAYMRAHICLSPQLLDMSDLHKTQ